ncbi:o-methylsterigmatocystin oxidoreductase [Trichoderma arundinaceum]|uniref:O-methylsterigmatocystin oxidoreductase n=1 Tax=Trichoderma arundinaceum TaxID=490622 RepID=A0A395P173_TRIAR|nr:o-methylsterigmatocystin oxidoreductase [Trichoderma arundinaceum]
MATTLLVKSLIVVVGYLIYSRFLRKHKNLPPGPKGVPLLGNIFNLPSKDQLEYEHWNSLSDKYGPIASVTVFGQPMIFIADKEIAQDILEKKSLTSSGRPVFHFANCCGYTDVITLQQLGKQFKSERKAMHQTLGTKTLVSKYADVQEKEVGRMLLRTLKTPEKIFDHLETEADAFILKIIYDYTVDPHGRDPLVGLIQRSVTNFARVAVPFARLVEFIPALQRLPDGFPGTGFKEEAKHYREEIRVGVDVPFNFVRKQMSSRNRTNSYVASLVQDYLGDSDELSSADARTIKWSAAALHAGAAETTVSTLLCFLLAMIKFPEAQRRAQEEVDRVTGGARLPVLSDREKMPFIEAMVTETLRWLPIVPLGIVHTASEDITYKGYDIPKGAYIFPEVWRFMQDPSVYPDPKKFDPERFLEPRNEPDPRWAVFGFGRRVCPGRYLADSALFLNLAYLVAVFDIGKATDEQGNEIEPKIEVARGMIARPKSFPLKVTPRSEKYVELIKAVERDHPWEEGDGSQLGELPPLTTEKK